MPSERRLSYMSKPSSVSPYRLTLDKRPLGWNKIQSLVMSDTPGKPYGTLRLRPIPISQMRKQSCRVSMVRPLEGHV